MSEKWKLVNDDSLSLVDKTVSFLMGEFCPPDVDPLWSVEYFRWKLGAKNPAGKGYLSVAVSDDKIIGSITITKKRLLIDGNEVIGGEVGDSYVSQQVHSSGYPENLGPYGANLSSYINRSKFARLAVETRSRAEADGICLIYGTPNSNSYPGYVQKLGYFDLKSLTIKSYFHPTSKAIVSMYPKIRALKGGGKMLEGGVVALFRSFYKIAGSKDLEVNIEVPTAFEINELWERIKPKSGFSLVKDATYWRHRYLEHPLATYQLFCIRIKGILIGIVATRLYTSLTGKRQLAILEWMKGQEVSIKRVILEILYFFKNSDVELFHCYANMSTAEAVELKGVLFIPKNRIPVIFADTPESRKLQLESTQFDLQMGNTDAV